MENTGLMGKILSFLLLLACVASFATGPSLPSADCFHQFIGLEEFHLIYPKWWVSGTPPRPETHTRLDKADLQRWVDAQPKELQPIFQRLADNLREVKQDEFERELKRSFEKFLADTPAGTKVLFLIDELELSGNPKSGLWTTALIRELFSDRSADFKFITPDQLPSVESKLLSGDYRLVIADDAIYSGSHIGHMVSKLYTKATIHVVSPYCRRHAPEVIQKRRGSETPEIKFYSTVNMPAVPEVMKGLSGAQYKYLNKLLDKNSLILDRNTLTFFSHKVADNVSFPTAVSYGNVYAFDASGELIVTDKVIPFLRLDGEPYYHRAP